MHGREQRERPLAFAELAVNSEVWAATHEAAPYKIGELRISLRHGAQRRDIEMRPPGRK
jgi:hypothetical protein